MGDHLVVPQSLLLLLLLLSPTSHSLLSSAQISLISSLRKRQLSYSHSLLSDLHLINMHFISQSLFLLALVCTPAFAAVVPVKRQATSSSATSTATSPAQDGCTYISPCGPPGW
ncbi:hypothetical protein FRB95_002961 [Tulasnella sp. JGI-2019a]|nr:hypothetical protein FRB95_002961 [Tulasnella sp. JGI-2019a]